MRGAFYAQKEKTKQRSGLGGHHGRAYCAAFDDPAGGLLVVHAGRGPDHGRYLYKPLVLEGESML